LSKIEVNAVEPQCGTTLTLGASGDTVTLGTGASQSGFGRTGTVDWQTTIKTTTFTAANGEGYFVNTTSGAVTVNLPAGSVGAIVSIKDYAQTFDTANCIVSANGSEKIENLTQDLTLNTEGIAVTLVYADATRGWQAVNSNEVTNSIKFVNATGGTITTSGDFKIHTFTGPGTFCVSCAGNPSGSTTVDYLVIAGGAAGGGGADASGGGGAGGYRFSNGTASGCYAAGPSPLGASALPVSVQAYPIAVGAGGSPNPGSATSRAGCGAVSTFSTITSAGGGSGGLGDITPSPGNKDGLNGGSGGGGGTFSPGSPGQGAVGSGNTPSVSPPQGNNGGTGATDNATYRVGGGGGGASATGVNVCNPAPAGGVGGAGLASSINGTPTTRAGGGGGGGHPTGTRNGGAGGSGGGGNGSRFGGPPFNPATAGTVNTGSGGGGSGHISGGTASGAGGSGIVIIRYKFQ
jgi:hypothetical protein